MKLTCWIIYNGFLPGNKFIDFAEMFQEAAIRKGHETFLYKNNELLPLLHDKNSILMTEEQTLPDYCIFTDKDIYLAKQLENLGVPVYNSAHAIAVSDDKIRTYQALANKNLPIPKTIIAPKTFGLKASRESYFFGDIIKCFGFPFIVKEAFGSFGEQVYLVNNEEELMQIIKQISDRPFVFQQFVKTSYGRDLRLQVVGEKVITAMKRTSENDFRANITTGGKMDTYKPSEQEKQIAIEATKSIGADFAGVDLLFGENDTPLVCEVNSNAHFRNLFDCTGVNVAYNVIDYIEEKIKEVVG